MNEIPSVMVVKVIMVTNSHFTLSATHLNIK